MLLQANDHVLFYGDSITDAGRNREATGLAGLGHGYASLIAALLLARYPEWKLQFSNRGNSGNRIYDLEDRLESDVLALQPSVVSILIGINDTWRRYDSGVLSPPDEFKASYARILSTLRERTDARILICEPFLLPIPDDRKAWREDLDPRLTVCRELAREFNTLYLPLDGLFAAASTRAPLAYWLPDGVHPSLAGHAFIAEQWLAAAS
ncbi:MAG: acyl-CoA thioesterase [Abditibacteriota bacterium]|nr:acyl-CoA thioesterase [Abditibacteriota bacterium]